MSPSFYIQAADLWSDIPNLGVNITVRSTKTVFLKDDTVIISFNVWLDNLLNSNSLLMSVEYYIKITLDGMAQPKYVLHHLHDIMVKSIMVNRRITLLICLSPASSLFDYGFPHFMFIYPTCAFSILI